MFVSKKQYNKCEHITVTPILKVSQKHCTRVKHSLRSHLQTLMILFKDY